MRKNGSYLSRAVFRFLLIVLLVLVVFDHVLVLSRAAYRIHQTRENGRLLSAFEELWVSQGIPTQAGPGTEGLPLPLADFPRLLVNSVIYVEDPGFFRHPGIEPGAIRRAIAINMAQGRIVYGGSTITQQLARNLALSPEKTIRRKYYEALTALYLDAVLTKNQILEWYLNLVELGPGVYGFEAASQTYYGRSASSLNPDQIARLVSVMPMPQSASPDTIVQVPVLAARYRYLREFISESIRGGARPPRSQ